MARQWDEQRIAAIDPSLRPCFPELLGPGEAVGTLRPEAAAALGLPASVVVSPGEQGVG